MPLATLKSFPGALTIQEEDGAITHLRRGLATRKDNTQLLKEAVTQLSAYLVGELTRFTLPLNPGGSVFQQSVFRAMSAIPFGQTRTYGDIAHDLGSHGQPVGRACGANPIPIIIPCHRVLSANGLGGYSGEGGTNTKIALLKLEGGYPFLI